MNAQLQAALPSNSACRQTVRPSPSVTSGKRAKESPSPSDPPSMASPSPNSKWPTLDQVAAVVDSANAAFVQWRSVPAPIRGEFVRQFGQKLREFKKPLATLVSWEAGKITQEALGEVQEMIDICDFAVGLSRQLYGKTIASERPGHRLTEQWHPLGPIGVISAFNFPVAVWAWNAAIAWVCGDPVVWKPSEKTPLTAIACQTLFAQTLADNPKVPPAISNLIVGGADVGQSLAVSPHLPLISATGSVPMGRDVAQTVAARLGRSLLELGGNNGMIVAPSADFELAIRSITFSAVGTCGQRCTSLRRAIVHESIADKLRDQLLNIYDKLPIGDPTAASTLVGPLIDERAFRCHGVRTGRGSSAGRHRSWWRTRDTKCASGRLLCSPCNCRDHLGCTDHSAGNLCSDSVFHAIQAISTKPSTSTTVCRKDLRRRFSPTMSAKQNCFARPPVPIAASPT